MKFLFLTGGSGGLGQAIATEFIQSDWQILAPISQSMNLKNIEEVTLFMSSKSVNLLVCAAGMIRDATLIQTSEIDWDDIFTINYQTASNCAKAVLPQMQRQGEGHIIFISSYSAIHPPIGQVAYSSAKAALIGLTTSLAAEYGKYNIRVNGILPGFLETPMTKKVSSQRKKQVIEEHSLGKLNTPQAVAKFIKFLHDKLPYTSGQIFQLDSRSP